MARPMCLRALAALHLACLASSSPLGGAGELGDGTAAAPASMLLAGGTPSAMLSVVVVVAAAVGGGDEDVVVNATDIQVDLEPNAKGIGIVAGATCVGCVLGALLGMLCFLPRLALRCCTKQTAPWDAAEVVEPDSEDEGPPPTAWCVGQTEAFLETCMHSQFLCQVQTTPSAVAVLGEVTLTYRQLREWAVEAGRMLRQAGVAQGKTVGLYLDGGLALYISILGAWMTGGAWFPVDREAPQQRIDVLLQEGCPEAVVAVDAAPFQKAPLAVLVPTATGERLNIVRGGETDHRTASKAMRGALSNNNANGSVAQIVYTSGSTGAPKGVIYSHLRLAHAAHCFATQVGIRTGTRVLQKTPNIWAVFRHEVYPALSRGGCVVVAEPERRKDPQYIAEILRQQAVNILVATPTIMDLVFDCLGGPLRDLRAAVCMGEGLPLSLAAKAYDATGFTKAAFTLYNFYGSTETENTVFEVPLPGSAEWQALDKAGKKYLPSGRPQPCTAVFVLDPITLEDLPRGARGEICFGGIMSDGYWRRSELTAERFVEHDAHGRLYRTGDLGRWSSAGSLEVVGRLDRQVKIRGIRIELEEVEVKLREAVTAAGGREAAAAAAPASEGEHLQLVGFVAPATVDVHLVRRECQARMPPYMVPTLIRALGKLPRLANQKVDLKTLAEEAKTASKGGEEETTAAVDSLGMLRALTRGQVEEDRWIHNQQAFWMLVVMVEHFNLVQHVAPGVPVFKVGDLVPREAGKVATATDIAAALGTCFGWGKDMTAFMFMMGFTDSRDPVRLGARDAVLFLVGLFLSGPDQYVMPPKKGPLKRFGTYFSERPLVDHGWFLYSALFTRLSLLVMHKLRLPKAAQVLLFIVAALLLPEDWMLDELPRSLWEKLHSSFGGFKYFDFRRTFLFLPACYLFAFHYGNAGVRWARRWAPRSRCTVAALVGAGWLGYLVHSVLNIALLPFQAIYVERPRFGSHLVTWHMMTHPSIGDFVCVWMYEVAALTFPVFLVAVALAYCPFHFKMMGTTTFGNYVIHPALAEGRWKDELTRRVIPHITFPRLGLAGNTVILLLFNACFCLLFAHTIGALFHYLLVRFFMALGCLVSCLARCCGRLASCIARFLHCVCPGGGRRSVAPYWQKANEEPLLFSNEEPLFTNEAPPSP